MERYYIIHIVYHIPHIGVKYYYSSVCVSTDMTEHKGKSVIEQEHFIHYWCGEVENMSADHKTVLQREEKFSSLVFYLLKK